MSDVRAPASTVDAPSIARLRISLANASGVDNGGLNIRVSYDAALLTYQGLERTFLTRNFTVIDNDVGG